MSWRVTILASTLALSEYSELQSKYEQQLQLNEAAEQFAHQVGMTQNVLILGQVNN